jgi:hypothetical protein
MRKVLIILMAAVLVLGGLALVLRNSALQPDQAFYNLKRAGEWLDVNFFIFGAPEKQAKHLELAGRRLDEYLALPARSATLWRAQRLAASYELELARAEFMAEQLALLDHKFLPNIQEVFQATFADQQKLAAALGKQKYLEGFSGAAENYNRAAIKVLLQKHQYSPADTLTYKRLVELRFNALMKVYNKLAAREKWRVDMAQKALAEGKEIEWAYDLLAPVQLRAE